MVPLLQVADIKRANGLLSDSAMFAKDKLLIPTQAMPPMGYGSPHVSIATVQSKSLQTSKDADLQEGHCCSNVCPSVWLAGLLTGSPSVCVIARGYELVRDVFASLCRMEYSTWAGMIVAQYGRFPGSHAGTGMVYGNGASGGSPPRQSAALDQLQRYYGTGDTCSEPGDFKPGVHAFAVNEQPCIV